MSSRLRAVATDTVAITSRGWYRSPSGAEVVIRDAVAAAVAGTRLYAPADDLPAPGPVPAVALEVTGESTLAAARRLTGDVACLVFASARRPGGGFLQGARAQEESIARASALYACLRAAPDFYAHHRRDRDPLYSDRVVHSPAVPVFRDDGGALLDAAYPVSMLTAAAPNLSAVRRGRPELAARVPGAVRRRAARVLAVAAAHGHRRLVLGAWGCGVFGNDPAVVAAAWRDALRERPAFERVVFAVLDPPGRTRATFEAVLTG